MENFNALEKAMCKELEAIQQKTANGTEMSVQDLEKVDKLTHALKSLKAYAGMSGKECEEQWASGYMSGNDQYAEAYNRGFADGRRVAERQSNMSGFYPPARPYRDPYTTY